MAPGAAGSARIGGAGAVRLGLRILAVVLLLLVLIGPSTLNGLLRRPHNPWPRRFLAGTAWLLGIHVRVRGAPEAGRVLILANHVSWIDIVALASRIGTAFVGHDGLAGVPLVRWLARQNDTVFVARHDRAGVGQQVAALRTALAEMGAVTLFPEGTTGDGVSLLPFKSSLLGALEPLPEGVAIQPVWLDYGPEATRIAWVGEETGLANFCRIVGGARPVVVTVHFLEPLGGEALASRKTITAAARAAVMAAMSRSGGG